MKKSILLLLAISLAACGPSAEPSDGVYPVAASASSDIILLKEEEYLASAPKYEPGDDTREFAQQHLTWVYEPGHVHRALGFEWMLSQSFVRPDSEAFQDAMEALAAEGDQRALMFAPAAYDTLSVRAAGGDRLAQFVFAYQALEPGNRDRETALRYLRELSPTEPAAMLFLGGSQMTGSDTERTEGAALMMSALRSGSLSPFFNSIVVPGLARSEPSLISPTDEADLRKALDDFIRRCPIAEEQKKPWADQTIESLRVSLAFMLETARGGPPDLDRAIQLYREAYSMGEESGENGSAMAARDALLRLGVALTDPAIPLKPGVVPD